MARGFNSWRPQVALGADSELLFCFVFGQLCFVRLQGGVRGVEVRERFPAI